MLTTEQLIKELETDLRSGDLTVTDKIGPGTMVCLTIKSGQFVSYAQNVFETIPEFLRNDLTGKKRGDFVGSYKVVGVFDVWDKAQFKSEF